MALSTGEVRGESTAARNPADSALRAAHLNVENALRELANLRDDAGLPAMGLDNMRREVTAMRAKLAANDNQTGK